MKKDINIPKVKDVYLAALQENIPDTDLREWNIYIINDKNTELELVIIISHGFSESKKTSTLRKTINHLPKKSFAKVETIQDNLFQFTNQFIVSFFEDNQLYDKTFTFKPNSINDKNLASIPLFQHKGILAE